MVKETELYDRLGVAPDAGHDQIRKAYYRRAKECHPDKHPGDKAKEAEFKAVSEAYQVLFNESSREKYDQQGRASFQGGEEFVDPRDVFAAVFGGPEFEPYIGPLQMFSDVNEGLQQRAQEAESIYHEREHEYLQLRAAHSLSAADEERARMAVIAARHEAEEARRKLEAAAKEEQQRKVKKVAATLQERIDEYLTTDAAGRQAWFQQLERDFETLRQANLGEPMLYAIGYAYVYEAQKQLGRHAVGVHRIAGVVEDCRERWHTFSLLMGGVGTAIGTVHAHYKLSQAAAQAENGRALADEERELLEQNVTQKALGLMWAVTQANIEGTVRSAVQAVVLAPSPPKREIPAALLVPRSEAEEYTTSLPLLSVARAEAIILIGQTFMKAMSFSAFAAKDKPPSGMQKATHDFEEKLRSSGVDVDGVRKSTAETHAKVSVAAQEAAIAAGTFVNRIFNLKKP